MSHCGKKPRFSTLIDKGGIKTSVRRALWKVQWLVPEPRP